MGHGQTKQWQASQLKANIITSTLMIIEMFAKSVDMLLLEDVVRRCNQETNSMTHIQIIGRNKSKSVRVEKEIFSLSKKDNLKLYSSFILFIVNSPFQMLIIYGSSVYCTTLIRTQIVDSSVHPRLVQDWCKFWCASYFHHYKEHCKNSILITRSSHRWLPKTW